MSRNCGPAAIRRIEGSRVPFAFSETASMQLQMLQKLPALHEGTFIITRMLTGMASLNVAFLSFALGSGVGNGCPTLDVGFRHQTQSVPNHSPRPNVVSAPG